MWKKCLGACRTRGLTAQAPNKTGAPALSAGRASKAPQKPSGPAAAPQAAPRKLAAKNVDSEIEDILSRIDSIAKK